MVLAWKTFKVFHCGTATVELAGAAQPSLQKCCRTSIGMSRHVMLCPSPTKGLSAPLVTCMACGRLFGAAVQALCCAVEHTIAVRHDSDRNTLHSLCNTDDPLSRP